MVGFEEVLPLGSPLYGLQALCRFSSGDPIGRISSKNMFTTREKAEAETEAFRARLLAVPENDQDAVIEVFDFVVLEFVLSG